ncbi:flagellar motor switch protein FliM [Limnohabitans radicicola]|uniref:Flagellar motor switch protein FliM n=1 Tax=Limnohabitans radicicola TaxID=2771427 RepID=A0A927FE01_9BURK|nr:flagellar motor switch protein FliM [Limnohabitans radicicola]MBD8048918.1 flagellar motor switch protein FliM [Limnohabitans radicicola]
MSDSQPLLTPEELAALSAALDDGSLGVDTGYNLEVQVRKHDLTTEDSSLGINVASLDMINERFIRLFRLGMLEVLRTSPRINPTHTQIVRFGDYIKDLKAPLSVNIIRMAPFRGYSMVVIEPTVVFSSLDSFFGGFGRGVGQLPPGRLFTPTETRIIKIILQVFFRSLKEAWSPVSTVDFEHVSSEINPQFAQIADENDLVVLCRFESESNNNSRGTGFIDMVIPYVALKPVRDLLRSRVQTGDGNEESDNLWRNQLVDAVKDAELHMNVLLGKLQISLSQLQQMQVGDVLHFKKADYARVMIRDLPVYDVEVGTMGSQTAVKIVEAISPAMNTTD